MAIPYILNAESVLFQKQWSFFVYSGCETDRAWSHLFKKSKHIFAFFRVCSHRINSAVRITETDKTEEYVEILSSVFKGNTNKGGLLNLKYSVFFGRLSDYGFSYGN